MCNRRLSGAIEIRSYKKHGQMNEPYITKELLDYLETTFPNQLPSQGDVELGEIRRLQGVQHVIHVLRELYRSQQNLQED